MRKNDVLRHQLFSRRSVMLALGQGALLSVLGGRLYHLQVSKANQYRTMSDSNRIKLFLIPPPRGIIYDRNNNILAVNQNRYRILLDKEIVKNIRPMMERIFDVLGISDLSKRQFYIKRALQNKARGVIQIYDRLTWQDVAKIEVNAPDLPGISVEVGVARYYPFSAISSHVVGYVGALSEEELDKNPLLGHPDVKVGKHGIEKAAETVLQGRAGLKRMEVNVHGLVVRELSQEPSIAGNNTTLTLDVRLQEFVMGLIDPRGASCVVMDVTNGDVLALASRPGFDPNIFPQGLTNEAWQTIHKNPYKPLINKATNVQYPPGSTFKLLVALAALKQKIDPSVTVYCPGYVVLGNRRFHCWKEGGHGTLSMRQAIMHSCNVYFYTMAKRIGVDHYAEVARSFGLGMRTGLELPSEKPGIVPDRKWKRETLKKEWQAGDTLNCGIGQGFVLATTLQLAQMTARLATGRIVCPHLFMTHQQAIPDHVKQFPPFAPIADLSPEYLALVQQGMHDVVNIPGGTAYGSRLPLADWRMAGKTGTSQVLSRKHPGQDRSKENVPWEERNHGLFVGYAPVDSPKYACAVVIEHGRSGSGAAAPIAKQVFTKLHELYVAPSLSPTSSTTVPIAKPNEFKPVQEEELEEVDEGVDNGMDDE
jgi:penicillin-binding protein 2